MHVEQTIWRTPLPPADSLLAIAQSRPQWVLVFGNERLLRAAQPTLQEAFTDAIVMGCSTAGEISAQGVGDDTLVLTAVHWDACTMRSSSTELSSMDDSHAAGVRLASGLAREGLRAVVVLGQGVQINGSALIYGMSQVLGVEVPIVGGLAGDAGEFLKTVVLDNDGVSATRLVCAGLYGKGLHVSHGVYGGWSSFGPARRVTKASGNVLFTLDDESALTMYKRYLGERAKDLPASGLLFPFSVVSVGGKEEGLLRTILGVDEATGSITLAGDVKEGGYLRMMQAGTDALVNGAEQAAQSLHMPEPGGLALMVSCVGRKLVMGGRVEEEVEAVAAVIGPKPTLAGFYSYGEISPTHNGEQCLLHNQTATITYFSESA